MNAFCLYESIHLFFWDECSKNGCNCSLVTFHDRKFFTIVRNRLTFDRDLFWDKFTELIFVKWIHLYVCPKSDLGNCNRFLQKLFTKTVFLFKKYLEIVLELFLTVSKKNFFDFLTLFLQNKPAAVENFCVIFYSMTVSFCHGLVKIYINNVDANFMRHILFSYEKPSNFTSTDIWFS